MPSIDAAAVESGGGPAGAIPRTDGMGHQPARISSRIQTRYPELTLPAWLGSVPGAWLVVPLVSGTELVGFVVLATPRVADRRKLGGARSAQDGEPAGRKLPGTDRGHRGAAGGTQIRRLQPDVGIRRSRPQEPGGATLADAAQCGTPQGQSGIPARHAGHRGARRRPDESPDAAVARRHHAAREAAAHRSGTCRPQRVRREGGLQRDDRRGLDARSVHDRT